MNRDPIHGWLRSLVSSRGAKSTVGVDQKHGKRGQGTIDRDEIRDYCIQRIFRFPVAKTPLALTNTRPSEYGQRVFLTPVTLTSTCKVYKNTLMN